MSLLDAVEATGVLPLEIQWQLGVRHRWTTRWRAPVHSAGQPESGASDAPVLAHAGRRSRGARRGGGRRTDWASCSGADRDITAAHLHVHQIILASAHHPIHSCTHMKCSTKSPYGGTRVGSSCYSNSTKGTTLLVSNTSGATTDPTVLSVYSDSTVCSTVSLQWRV